MAISNLKEEIGFCNVALLNDLTFSKIVNSEDQRSSIISSSVVRMCKIIGL